MTAPVRLTAVLTHPIQYYAPWFRHIQQHAPEIALTVVYATQPTPEQQGVGFDRAFEWDVPLTDGYRSITVRAAEARRSDRQRPLHRSRRAGDWRCDRRDQARRGDDSRLALAHPRSSVVGVPAPRHPDALSWRLTSAERACGLDASAVVAQDAAPAAAVRRVSLARTPRRRVPREVRRTRLPDFPDAARGRQRAVRDEPHRGISRRRRAPRRAAAGASIPMPSCRCLPESWLGRSIHWMSCAPRRRSAPASRCWWPDRGRSRRRCAPRPSGTASI